MTATVRKAQAREPDTRLVTKSIRLTEQEARELAKVVESGPFTEAALMKRWVLDGLQRHKLEEAVRAYQRREVSIGEGAIRAGVPYHRFWEELERRNVVMLEDPQFLQGLEQIGEAFQLPELAAAARQVAREQAAASDRGQAGVHRPRGAGDA